MCARIFYLFLAALFVFLVATIAAFRYLDWWQALLVSVGAFVVLVLAGRWFLQFTIRSTIGRVGESMKGLFDDKSRVLRNASADIHTVRPAAAPREFAALADDPALDEIERAELKALRWYEIEATIYPDPSRASSMSHWDVTDLRLVPATATPWKPLSDSQNANEQEFDPFDVVLMDEGKPVIPVDGKVSGPRRVRFVVGIPSAIRDVQFRYYFEQFGRFRIPPALSAGPAF